MTAHRWEHLGEPASPAEAAALDRLRELVLADPAAHGWTNLTFTDMSGRSAEVDALVVTRAGVLLLELKGWHGTISGTQQTWTVANAAGMGVRYERNPWYGPDKTRA